MKRRILSTLLALSMVLTITPAAFAVENIEENTIAISDSDSLISAIQGAADGECIDVPAGTYDIGSLTVNKAVSLQGKGAGETILTGSITYKNLSAEGSEAISIKGITLKAPSETHQGLCWSSGVNNRQLTVSDCQFTGWEYAIGVNSGAAGNTLNIESTSFTDTWCAISVKTGNKIVAEEATVTADGAYAVQVFGTQNEQSFDGYYETVASYNEDAEDDSLNTPDAGGATSGEDGAAVATPGNLAQRIASAQDGDTIRLTAGTYNISEPLSINKRVNLQGAGEDKTTIVGAVQYVLAAVEEGAGASISVSGINFRAGENAVQGLLFKGAAPNTEQKVGITVSDCTFDGWTYGLAMHSHANGCTLTVEGSTFNTWCGINFNQDTQTEGQKADNTLHIGEDNIFNCSYAVEQFDNHNATGEPAKDNYYETAEDYENNTPIDGAVTRVTNATELQNAITNAGEKAVTIELAGNIALDAPITIPTGADIAIDGNGYTISYRFDGSTGVKTAFTGSAEGQLEGVPANVTLTVTDAVFENTGSSACQGYAVLLGSNAYGTKVELKGCSLNNLYCAVLSNGVFAASGAEQTYPSVSITGSAYTNTKYGYSVDEITAGALQDACEITFEGNELNGAAQEELWTNVVYAQAEGATKAFATIQEAINAADAGSTITVAPGTYNESVTFGGKSLTIKGANVGIDPNTGARGEESIFTGTMSTSGDSFHADQTVVIDGFTFSGDGLKVGDNNGNTVGKLTVQNCVMEMGGNLQSNTVGHNQYNYFVRTNGEPGDGNYASVTVQNNKVTGTPAANINPIMLWDVENATVTGNTIELAGANASQAINISKMAEKATVVVSQNTISGAANGGIYVTTWLGSNVDAADKTFSGSITADNNVFTNTAANEGFYEIFFGVEAESGYSTLTGAYAASGNVADGQPIGAVVKTGLADDTAVSKKISFYSDNAVVSVVTTNQDSIVMPAAPEKAGYTFQGWSNGSNTYSEGASVTISGDTDFHAQWRKNDSGSSSTSGSSSSSGRYTVSVEDADHGSIQVSPSRADRGDTVTITVNPDEGYALESLIVRDSNGGSIDVERQSDTRYTFEMPSGRVTIEAEFVRIEEDGLPFADVPANTEYYDAVAWAVENGVTTGTSATTFSPNNACTRAQMVTFLWRAVGSPAPESTVNPFTDVSASDYCYEAVLWAVEKGITNGTSATTFSPDAIVTRGQTVTFLYRHDGSAMTGSSGFADVAADAYYADAVAWAVSEGVTNGTSATAFSPDDACTRAQIVTFLYRYMAQ